MRSPMSDPAGLASEVRRAIDDEHLRLLRLAYLVMGWMSVAVSLVPFGILAFFGAVFGAALGAAGQKQAELAPFAFFGCFYFAIFGFVALVSVAKGALDLVAAKAIAERRSTTLIQVAAAVSSEKVTLLTRLADAYNATNPEFDGTCVAVTIQRVASGLAAQLLAAGWPQDGSAGPAPVGLAELEELLETQRRIERARRENQDARAAYKNAQVRRFLPKTPSLLLSGFWVSARRWAVQPPPPTPSPDSPSRIVIPAIAVDLPMVPGMIGKR